MASAEKTFGVLDLVVPLNPLALAKSGANLDESHNLSEKMLNTSINFTRDVKKITVDPRSDIGYQVVGSLNPGETYDQAFRWMEQFGDGIVGRVGAGFILTAGTFMTLFEVSNPTMLLAKTMGPIARKDLAEIGEMRGWNPKTVDRWSGRIGMTLTMATLTSHGIGESLGLTKAMGKALLMWVGATTVFVTSTVGTKQAVRNVVGILPLSHEKKEVAIDMGDHLMDMAVMVIAHQAMKSAQKYDFLSEKKFVQTERIDDSIHNATTKKLELSKEYNDLGFQLKSAKADFAVESALEKELAVIDKWSREAKEGTTSDARPIRSDAGTSPKLVQGRHPGVLLEEAERAGEAQRRFGERHSEVERGLETRARETERGLETRARETERGLETR
ncbi:MAG TPA: hypothetical protein PKB12_09910, partial [Elusimicrobiota bacterium]|nr:hypothetical protein [Elusimicrobiota bacterium]